MEHSVHPHQPGSNSFKPATLRVVFMGTPEFSVHILEALINAKYQLVGVYTNPDARQGRKKALVPSPVKQLAASRNIPVFQPQRLRTPEALDQFGSLAPDLLIVAAYGKILPEAMLTVPRYGALNVHASLLPLLRGASPIHYALLNGVSTTGVTIMRMDKGMDTGPILSTAKLSVLEADTFITLNEKLAHLGARLLLETIPGWIAGSVPEVPQDHTRATVTKLLSKQDGQINWNSSARAISQQIKAFEVWPTSYSFLQPPQASSVQSPLRVAILEATVLKQQSYAESHPVGTLFRISAQPASIAVQCADGILLVAKLQIAGKRPMTAPEFISGYRRLLGARFVSDSDVQ